MPLPIPHCAILIFFFVFYSRYHSQKNGKKERQFRACLSEKINNLVCCEQRINARKPDHHTRNSKTEHRTVNRRFQSDAVADKILFNNSNSEMIVCDVIKCKRACQQQQYRVKSNRFHSVSFYAVCCCT